METILICASYSENYGSTWKVKGSAIVKFQLETADYENLMYSDYQEIIQNYLNTLSNSHCKYQFEEIMFNVELIDAANFSNFVKVSMPKPIHHDKFDCEIQPEELFRY